MGELTPEMELVLQALRLNPGSTARALTRLLREAGMDIRKGQVNSALYTALGRRLVEKQEGTPPRWLALEATLPNTSAGPAMPPSRSSENRVGERAREGEPLAGRRWRLLLGAEDEPNS